MPDKVDEAALNAVFESEIDAFVAGAKARRDLLDLLGFLSWILSVRQEWTSQLTAEMIEFVLSLKLNYRRKRGCLLVLGRDWKTMNVYHYMRHSVPFHILWSDIEEREPRFFRFSPTFLTEYIRCVDERNGEPVPLAEMPCYEEKRDVILRFDDFLQDTLLGQYRSWKRPRFHPNYNYRLVRHDGWGAQVLTNPVQIDLKA